MRVLILLLSLALSFSTAIPAQTKKQGGTEKKQPSEKGHSQTTCHATTDKGTRCKRLAQQGGQYCWQHQGKRNSKKKTL